MQLLKEGIEKEEIIGSLEKEMNHIDQIGIQTRVKSQMSIV